MAPTTVSAGGSANADREPTPVVLSPNAHFHQLSEEQLKTLATVGEHWNSALAGGGVPRSSLPLDPDLSSGGMRSASRYERLAELDGFVPLQPGSLVTTEVAVEPDSQRARLWHRLRRVLIGPPLATSALVHERLGKVMALAVLSSDALSSVAYGTEAMLSVLILAGSAALGYSLPIAAVIVVLMVAVGASYRQTIRAYPQGGGSYIVASDNLGQVPGLCAAIGLMIDYVLTVSVSVVAGVAAITSAMPELHRFSVEMGVGFIGVVMLGNLRGIRQSGKIFAAPTYAFVVAMLVLIAVGLVRAASRGWTALPPPPLPAVEGISLFLILRAFASGSSAMTGIEAISNGIPVFKPPEWRNARTAMTWMVALLAAMFAGITLIVHLEGVVPNTSQTILSQLASRAFGRGLLYAYVQGATALILVLAANTAFQDLPRLLYFLARDRFAPAMFLRMGDRLAHSNGIIFLALVAASLLVVFQGNIERLIALYAVGVFLAFTLSQTGMVVHWLRRRGPGWRTALMFNAFGAVLSAAVLTVIAVAKFGEGAWSVVLLVPLMVIVLRRIRTHYQCAEAATALRPLDPRGPIQAIPPPRPSSGAASSPPEQAESPGEIEHLVIVPVSRLDLPNLRALAYAASLDQPVLAIFVAFDQEEASRMRYYWKVWGNHIPLEIIVSPYRLVRLPLVRYVRLIRALRPDLTLTVIMPMTVVHRAWQRVLHNDVQRRLQASLLQVPGVLVASVPFHLPPC
jgi:amino acid transporter